MTQSPVSPASFDKVIKATLAVKTSLAFAALTCLLFFLAFLFVVFLTSGIDRLVLGSMILIFWMIYSSGVVLLGFKLDREQVARDQALVLKQDQHDIVP